MADRHQSFAFNRASFSEHECRRTWSEVSTIALCITSLESVAFRKIETAPFLLTFIQKSSESPFLRAAETCKLSLGIVIRHGTSFSPVAEIRRRVCSYGRQLRRRRSETSFMLYGAASCFLAVVRISAWSWEGNTGRSAQLKIVEPQASCKRDECLLATTSALMLRHRDTSRFQTKVKP